MVLPLFQEWKEKHRLYPALADAPTATSSGTQEPNRVLIEDSDEASQPETPDSEIFDHSCFSDTELVPTPLTEADSVRTPIQGPTCILDSSIPDTPPGPVDQAPSSIANNDNSTVNAITKDISTLSLSHARSTSDKFPVDSKPSHAESIPEDDEVSFQGTSERLSVIPKRKPVAGQTVSDVSPVQRKAPEDEDESFDHPINIEGIGIGRLYRQGTLKRGSPILKALTTPPTFNQRKHGVVYVLQHTKDENVFKIGYTAYNAVKRQHQPRNCYGKNTKVIYESETDFAGANKAELLAHAFLGNHNLKVPECESCGGSHREWYHDRTGDVLIATLKVMEDFVRLPAHELKAGEKGSGEMVVSQEAERRIKSMFDISVQGLQGSMTTHNMPASIQMDSRESAEASDMTTTQTTIPQAKADIPLESIEAEPSKNSERFTAANLGRFAGTTMGKLEKLTQRVRVSFSREGTPESSDSRQPPSEGENLFVTFLWTLGGGNSEDAASKEGKVPRGLNALVQAVIHKKDKLKEEFATGVQEGKAAS
uniref:WGS project CBMF000000000 data, contig CS5834_c000237 n=1 Tax=Fusarium pseudograminearum CS5834 TaxID=1318459 RepID=A0A096PDP4_FUSPS|nr:unnamed protein product [Fusarium pseudograminearum CS5834]